MKEVCVQCPYRRTVAFRRSGFSKSAWEHIVHLFHLTQEPNKVQSITVEGEDDYGHLILHLVLDEE